MADVELLPCPFCGSAPRFDSGHGDAVCVLCGECGASSDFSPAGREDEAAAAWNTRANLAPLQAENERLRAEVREAREFRDKMANAIGNDQLRRFIEKHGEPVPLTIRMQQAEARAERLAEALRTFSDVLERLAFAIRAPNTHTPQLVELAIAMRAAALAQEDRNG